MPRLLQIDTCLGILSTGRITEGIGKLARDNGWETYIAHGARYVGKTMMKSYKVSTRYSEYVHYFKSRVFDMHGLGSILDTKRLIEHIENDIRPDIIHLHCIHGYYMNYQLFFEYINKTSIPIVWTFHDCWAFTGHCAHFVSAECFKWCENGCISCPLLSTYPQTILDGSRRNFDLKKSLFGSNKNLNIVAVSEWMHSLVKKSFFSEKSICVIRNGVDISKFYPCSEKLKKFTILGVAGSWGKDKGLSDFIKLRRALSNDEYDITIVGLTSEQVDKLPEGISGISRTDSISELSRLYSESTVLVNPTYADTFPTVNLESLACGTPVITYETGGSPEAINEETGVVVPRGDIRALVQAIKRIKYHPLSSHACRERALENFDQQKCYIKYLNLYSKLIENGNM